MRCWTVSRLADDFHEVGYNEARIEAHTELPNDVLSGRTAFFLKGLNKLLGAAASDRSEVIDELLLGHANTVVFDNDLLLRVADVHENLQGLVRQIFEALLLQSIRTVGEQLPQKYFLVSVKALGNDVQELLCLGLELFGFGVFFVAYA